jgi:hypothetical protein
MQRTGEIRVTDHFTCSICGKEHDGLVKDLGYKLPDVVWNIPEPERSEKARYSDDLCRFGERYFIRCVLAVPFTEASGEFGWGAWAEVDWSVFKLYLEFWGKDGSSEPVREGTLANSLPAYEHSLGMPVLIQFMEPTKRPSLRLKRGSESQLAIEQREGIDVARYHEILSIIARRRASP